MLTHESIFQNVNTPMKTWITQINMNQLCLTLKPPLLVVPTLFQRITPLWVVLAYSLLLMWHRPECPRWHPSKTEAPSASAKIQWVPSSCWETAGFWGSGMWRKLTNPDTIKVSCSVLDAAVSCSGRPICYHQTCMSVSRLALSGITVLFTNQSLGQLPFAQQQIWTGTRSWAGMLLCPP